MSNLAPFSFSLKFSEECLLLGSLGRRELQGFQDSRLHLRHQWDRVGDDVVPPVVVPGGLATPLAIGQVVVAPEMVA